MAKVILHKGYNPELRGAWFWSREAVHDDFRGIHTDPYVVEIPDEFELGETMTGEKMYFKDGCSAGFVVGSISNTKNCAPYLIGAELIKLKVLGEADEEE